MSFARSKRRLSPTVAGGVSDDFRQARSGQGALQRCAEWGTVSNDFHRAGSHKKRSGSPVVWAMAFAVKADFGVEYEAIVGASSLGQVADVSIRAWVVVAL